MKHVILLGTALLLTTTFSTLTHAQDSDLVSLSAGIWDVGDDESAGDFRLEYRWGTPFLWEIKPWTGGEITSDASFWLGGGILADLEVSDRLIITPSFGVGLYDEGDSDLDLGYPIEFRSQIEAGYRFNNDNRVSVSFGHLSNASLDDNNPGTEVLGLYWHLPTDQVFH